MQRALNNLRVSAPPPSTTLHNAFLAFIFQGNEESETQTSYNEMDVKVLLRLCKDSGFLFRKCTGRFTSVDVTEIHNMVKSEGADTITFEQFQEACKIIAERKSTATEPATAEQVEIAIRRHAPSFSAKQINTIRKKTEAGAWSEKDGLGLLRPYEKVVNWHEKSIGQAANVPQPIAIALARQATMVMPSERKMVDPVYGRAMDHVEEENRISLPRLLNEAPGSLSSSHDLGSMSRGRMNSEPGAPCSPAAPSIGSSCPNSPSVASLKSRKIVGGTPKGLAARLSESIVCGLNSLEACESPKAAGPRTRLDSAASLAKSSTVRRSSNSGQLSSNTTMAKSRKSSASLSSSSTMAKSRKDRGDSDSGANKSSGSKSRKSRASGSSGGRDGTFSEVAEMVAMLRHQSETAASMAAMLRPFAQAGFSSNAAGPVPSVLSDLNDLRGKSETNMGLASTVRPLLPSAVLNEGAGGFTRSLDTSGGYVIPKLLASSPRPPAGPSAPSSPKVASPPGHDAHKGAVRSSMPLLSTLGRRNSVSEVLDAARSSATSDITVLAQ